MLTNTLNTNEVKNAAGTEVEYTRLSIGDRKTEFAIINEVPSQPNRLTISHTESGTGLSARRRSVVRFDVTDSGQVDQDITNRCSAYIVLDSPVGNITNSDLQKEALSALISFVASLGASTTILYDCTGNGAACLISGGI